MDVTSEKNKLLAKEKTDGLLREYSKTRDVVIREKIILSNLGLVHSLAKRFVNRGISLETLVSVGSIGLTRAVDGFDPNREVEFATYANAIILGEIKHYFRDSGWTLKVPRSVQELYLIVNKCIPKLTQRYHRSPTITEIATELNTSEEEILESLEAGYAYTPYSLDAEIDLQDGEQSTSIIDCVPNEDESLKNLLQEIDIEKAINKLEKRERLIIMLIFYDDLTQAQIAQRLRISQMHVSRLQQKALTSLKAIIGMMN
ncbi:MAG: SigB/SigF/SigG family RNA polymerase sigma factor [bacterium]